MRNQIKDILASLVFFLKIKNAARFIGHQCRRLQADVAQSNIIGMVLYVLSGISRLGYFIRSSWPLLAIQIYPVSVAIQAPNLQLDCCAFSFDYIVLTQIELKLLVFYKKSWNRSSDIKQPCETLAGKSYKK